MLPTTNITTTLVGTTIGVSTRNIRQQIVNAKSGGTNGLAFNPTDGKKYNNALPYGNLWSSNSPFEWYMPKDSKGICTGECYCRTRRLSDNKVAYRLGDWRGYNHTAKLPTISIRDKSFSVTIPSGGYGKSIISFSLNTGDYNWKQNIDASYNNQRIIYVINIKQGRKESNGSITWFDGYLGSLKYTFDKTGEIDDTLTLEVESGGSVGTQYYFKAIMTMEYQYYPGTVQQAIRSIYFTNHTINIESSAVPVAYVATPPADNIEELRCWYTDETDDHTFTSAYIISQSDVSGAWKKVTAQVTEEGANNLDWDFYPDVYMTVTDKNDVTLYREVYCNAFPLRMIPGNDKFTFNIVQPSSVTISAWDKVYIDIKIK